MPSYQSLVDQTLFQTLEVKDINKWGRVILTPPQCILVFNFPSRDRVKLKSPLFLYFFTCQVGFSSILFHRFARFLQKWQMNRQKMTVFNTILLSPKIKCCHCTRNLLNFCLNLKVTIIYILIRSLWTLREMMQLEVFCKSHRI